MFRLLPTFCCCLSLLSLGAMDKVDPVDAAQAYLQTHYAQWGLQAGDMAEYRISDVYRSRHNGIYHVYFQQHHRGLPVAEGIAGIHVDGAGKVVYATSRFVAGLQGLTAVRQPALSGPEAWRRAQAYRAYPFEEVEAGTGRDTLGYRTLRTLGDDEQTVRYRLVWLPSRSERALQLCWELLMGLPGPDGNAWTFWVDARTGEMRRAYDRTLDCGPAAPMGMPKGPGGPLPPDVRSYSAPANETETAYRVFPLPTENPYLGSRELVVDPARAEASPLGWHTDDSTTYSITRGNNAHAFLDTLDANTSQGDEPDGGPQFVFDFPFRLRGSPEENAGASVTQLFYLTNYMHDWAYHFGFTEAAGNYQQVNFSGLGAGGDPVLAQAQDGGGLNNANFTISPDGLPGRMQMYLWAQPTEWLTVLHPQGLKGRLATRDAAFGPSVRQTPVAGELVAAMDGSDRPAEACANLINRAEIRGKIALIDRGGCTFQEKVLKAQRAGAIAVIIANYDDQIVPMGEVESLEAPAIPSVMIKASDARLLRERLPEGVRVAIEVPANEGPELVDGAFDNGIVTHEYGHGISTRLTGGPGQIHCLANDEQMGEGWSDFFALVLTTAGPQEAPRGIGSFVRRRQDPAQGIRRAPYSTDKGINPLLFDDIIGTRSPHQLGEVWAQMLWDLYWAMVDQYGWAEYPDTGGGNHMAVQLVMDGLKLQACKPGFIEARDAILAADRMNYQGANQCLIWSVFARRGLGFGAVDDDPDDRNDARIAHDLPPSCREGLAIEKTMSPNIAPGDTIRVQLNLTHYDDSLISGLQVVDALPEHTVLLAGTVEQADLVAVDDRRLTLDIDVLKANQTLTITYLLGTDPAWRSETLFYDDFSDTDPAWEARSLEGNDGWERLDTLARRGTHVWMAPNTRFPNDQVLVWRGDLPLQAEQPILRFHHQYDIEPGEDGALLELSLDGGRSWTPVERSRFFRHPYRGKLAYDALAIVDLDAFWGDSEDQVVSYVDLSDLRGENVSLRFRLGSTANSYDDLVSGEGWKLDAIEILDMRAYSSEACLFVRGRQVACARPDGRGSMAEPSALTSTAEPLVEGGKLRLFPNPADRQVSVRLRGAFSEAGSLQLLHADGRLIRSLEVQPLGGTFQTDLEVGDLPAGYYLLRYRSGGELLSSPLIIR